MGSGSPVDSTAGRPLLASAAAAAHPAPTSPRYSFGLAFFFALFVRTTNSSAALAESMHQNISVPPHLPNDKLNTSLSRRCRSIKLTKDSSPYGTVIHSYSIYSVNSTIFYFFLAEGLIVAPLSHHLISIETPPKSCFDIPLLPRWCGGERERERRLWDGDWWIGRRVSQSVSQSVSKPVSQHGPRNIGKGPSIDSPPAVALAPAAAVGLPLHVLGRIALLL